MNDGDKIAGHLRTIRRCWPDMLPTGPKASHGEVVSATKEPPPPAPIAVLSLRREVCEVLAEWVHFVVKYAVDVNGGHMKVHLDNRRRASADAVQLAGWLLTWADWLADHDGAGEAAMAELGTMARWCDDVVAQRRARRFRVGPCIDHGTTDMGERVPCTGTLVATLSTDDDLLPSVLRCDVDPMHAYTASEWRRLGERIYATTLDEMETIA